MLRNARDPVIIEIRALHTRRRDEKRLACALHAWLDSRIIDDRPWMSVRTFRGSDCGL